MKFRLLILFVVSFTTSYSLNLQANYYKWFKAESMMLWKDLSIALFVIGIALSSHNNTCKKSAEILKIGNSTLVSIFFLRCLDDVGILKATSNVQLRMGVYLGLIGLFVTFVSVAYKFNDKKAVKQ